MSDEFSGLDFALGSVRGFRTWTVTVEGKLQPLHQSGVWTPGENTAECKGFPGKEAVPRPEPMDYKQYNADVEEWRKTHTMDDCTHGFYAYFQTGETYASNDPTVSGVIEGYGEVLIGTKGFRAAKARILALSIEPHQGIWNLDPFVVANIRRNYPNIPLFDSSFAMHAEFPADSGALIEEVA